MSIASIRFSSRRNPISMSKCHLTFYRMSLVFGPKRNGKIGCLRSDRNAEATSVLSERPRGTMRAVVRALLNGSRFGRLQDHYSSISPENQDAFSPDRVYTKISEGMVQFCSFYSQVLCRKRVEPSSEAQLLGFLHIARRHAKSLPALQNCGIDNVFGMLHNMTNSHIMGSPQSQCGPAIGFQRKIGGNRGYQ